MTAFTAFIILAIIFLSLATFSIPARVISWLPAGLLCWLVAYALESGVLR